MNMREISRIKKFLQAAREHIDPALSVQQLLVILEVGTNPDGVDQTSIVRNANLRRAATSKNIANLSALTATKQKGPGLLMSDLDPMNLRIRVIKFTPKGKKVFEKICEVLK